MPLETPLTCRVLVGALDFQIVTLKYNLPEYFYGYKTVFNDWK